jgi:hypothetical protein
LFESAGDGLHFGRRQLGRGRGGGYGDALAGVVEASELGGDLR